MARDFDGSTGYLSASYSALSNEPITMACWAKIDSATANQVLMGLGNDGFDGFYALGAFGAVAGDPIGALKNSDASVSGRADSATGYSTGVWTHCAAVFASDTSRTAYKDGVAGAANTTSVADPTPDFVSIGALRRGTVTNLTDGVVAEAGIWNVALSALEIAALAARVSPLRIRPQNLVRYWQVHGVSSPENCLVSGALLTLSGTAPLAAHAPVQPPFFGAAWAPYVAGGTPVKELAGSIGITTVFAGSAGLIQGLTGSIAARATFAGHLSASFAVAGAIQAQTAFAGDLTVTAIGAPVKELAGSVAVQTTFNGALGLRMGVAGSITSQVTFAGTLTGNVVAVELAGVLSAAFTFGLTGLETESGSWGVTAAGAEAWTTASIGGEGWTVQGPGSEVWTRQ